MDKVAHANVPVFIPHLGCPHQCSFCDQKTISGAQGALPSPEQVAAQLEKASESLGKRTRSAQIAFFGGSFTAVQPEYRRALLRAVQPFLQGSVFSGIRISTRPDCIDREMLEELRQFGVTAIELGAQSMSDAVLAKNGRGHRAEDTIHSSRLIRQKGFSLGLQMMTGLPGDSRGGAWDTAKRLAALEPDTMRIYPALVLENTPLAQWYRSGVYRPQTLEEAVELCAQLLGYFESQGIRVIRLGLHNEESARQNVLAGPWHPAFRELCESRIMLDKALVQIGEQALCGFVELRVHPLSVSKMAGHRRGNIKKLEEMGMRPVIRRDERLSALEVTVQKG